MMKMTKELILMSKIFGVVPVLQEILDFCGCIEASELEMDGHNCGIAHPCDDFVILANPFINTVFIFGLRLFIFLSKDSKLADDNTPKCLPLNVIGHSLGPESIIRAIKDNRNWMRSIKSVHDVRTRESV